jgi:hypothetical protein
VIWAVREKGYSQRRACRLVGLHPAVAKRWHVVPRYALPALGMALGDGQEARWFTKPRLGRSLQDLVGFLSELRALGVDLFLHQQGLDTTTPAGKAMFQMLGVFAEFERAMIQERVRAGLARAKSEGKRLGRPRIAPELVERGTRPVVPTRRGDDPRSAISRTRVLGLRSSDRWLRREGKERLVSWHKPSQRRNAIICSVGTIIYFPHAKMKYQKWPVLLMCRDSFSKGFFHTLGKRHTPPRDERLLGFGSERAGKCAAALMRVPKGARLPLQPGQHACPFSTSTGTR